MIQNQEEEAGGADHRISASGKGCHPSSTSRTEGLTGCAEIGIWLNAFVDSLIGPCNPGFPFLPIARFFLC